MLEEFKNKEVKIYTKHRFFHQGIVTFINDKILVLNDFRKGNIILSLDIIDNMMLASSDGK